VTRILALLWPTLRAAPPSHAAQGAGSDPAQDAGSGAVDVPAMLDRLDDLSPRVEAVDRGVALVDVTGLGPSLGDERRIAARAVALVREVTTLPVRAGVGENRWLAVLAARLALTARPDPAVPIAFHAFPAGLEATRAVLATLPLALLPADPDTRQRFALFGLTTMGELAALPRSAVGAQFGATGERLQSLARGEDPRPLTPRRRPERLTRRVTFEPPMEGIGGTALVLRRACAELCDALRLRHLAPGRAILTIDLEDAPALSVELTFPEPALEPDWIARLLIGRMEAATRTRQLHATSPEREEARVVAIGLAFDRLSDPAARQLPAFQAQAGRWEELRWSLERLATRFGEGRLWRARTERPNASLPERQSSLRSVGDGREDRP
jgi:nucleotidyltransferase/DNA polymerase involved in DNA repair